jgi:hypothetical protein
MTYQAIGLGTTVGDGTGDTIRAGGDKVNDNFVEIYSLLGTGTALTSGISATATVVTLAGPSITGVASFADGSNTAPSITNTGDTNTGIYFGAADTVNITTGGTKRIEIDSSGLDVTGVCDPQQPLITEYLKPILVVMPIIVISASTTNRSWIYGAFDTAAGYSNGAWYL